MNSKISIVTLLMIATLTMFFTPAMVTQVQGSHPEAEAERDECLDEAFANFYPKHSDDSAEDAEAFKEWSDDKSECIEEYNEDTELDVD